jgi:hypothetical protein
MIIKDLMPLLKGNTNQKSPRFRVEDVNGYHITDDIIFKEDEEMEIVHISAISMYEDETTIVITVKACA